MVMLVIWGAHYDVIVMLTIDAQQISRPQVYNGDSYTLKTASSKWVGA